MAELLGIALLQLVRQEERGASWASSPSSLAADSERCAGPCPHHRVLDDRPGSDLRGVRPSMDRGEARTPRSAVHGVRLPDGCLERNGWSRMEGEAQREGRPNAPLPSSIASWARDTHPSEPIEGGVMIEVRSPAFSEGDTLPVEFTCDGDTSRRRSAGRASPRAPSSCGSASEIPMRQAAPSRTGWSWGSIQRPRTSAGGRSRRAEPRSGTASGTMRTVVRAPRAVTTHIGTSSPSRPWMQSATSWRRERSRPCTDDEPVQGPRVVGALNGKPSTAAAGSSRAF